MNAIVKLSAAVSLTMSSQEIAALTDKRHDHVLRDIRTMLIGLYGDAEVNAGIPDKDLFEVFCERMGWGIASPKLGNQRIQGVKVSRDSRGYLSEISLDYNHTMTLIAGYSVKLRKTIIDRWQQLEEQLSAPALPKSLPEALRLAADLAEQKALAEQQRDEAIATKALIGSKREATAMATAAAAKREAHKLEVELDRSKMYASVKRVEREYPGQKINWRVLKRKSEEVGIPSIDVFDQNYGSVKAYHAEVWRKAYSIEIAQAKGAAHA